MAVLRRHRQVFGQAQMRLLLAKLTSPRFSYKRSSNMRRILE